MSTPVRLYELFSENAIDGIVANVTLLQCKDRLGVCEDTVQLAIKRLADQGCITINTLPSPSGPGISRREFILHKPYLAPRNSDKAASDDIRSKIYPLWMQGLSTAEIGRRINLSKNGVVGQTARMRARPDKYPGMEGRPSPIRCKLAERLPKPHRASKDTLAPLASIIAPPPAPAVAAAHDRRMTAPVITAKPMLPWRPPPIILAPARPRPEPVAKAYVPRGRKCLWPMWGDGKPTHVYCDEPAVGPMWCAEHHKIGHVRHRNDQHENHPDV